MARIDDYLKRIERSPSWRSPPGHALATEALDGRDGSKLTTQFSAPDTATGSVALTLPLGRRFHRIAADQSKIGRGIGADTRR